MEIPCLELQQGVHFCPFDSSLVAACYESFFSDDNCIAPDTGVYRLTTVSKLEAAECISQCLSDIQCMRQTPGCKCFYYIAWGAFPYESFQ